MAHHLSFGQFIGERRHTAVVSGFHFAELANAPGHVVPRHTHADAHFIFVVSGVYETCARHAHSPCGAATLLFNPSGTTHHDHFISETGRFVALSIAPDRLADLQDGFAPIDHSIALRAGQTTWIATRIQRELQGREPATPLILEGLALELLGFTIRSMPGRQHRSPPAWLRRAREIIEDRCTDSITIREVAAEVGVHPYHLARTFRHFLRRSPGEYLRDCRVRHATDLICRTNMTLAAIALDCGFSDQSQFTRSYRRHTGTTPGAMRVK